MMDQKERVTEREIRLDAANRAAQYQEREKTFNKSSAVGILMAVLCLVGMYNFPHLILWLTLGLIFACIGFIIAPIVYVKYREKHLNMELYEVKTLAVTALILEEYEVRQRSGGYYTVRNYVLRFTGDLEWQIPTTAYLWSQHWRRIARLLYEETARDDLFYVVLNKKNGKILTAYPCKWFTYTSSK